MVFQMIPESTLHSSASSSLRGLHKCAWLAGGQFLLLPGGLSAEQASL